MVAPVALPMHAPSYAEFIRRLLRNLGKNQSDLARATGLSRATVSAILSGQQRLKLEHQNLFAKFFRYTPGEFADLLAGRGDTADSPASFEDRVADLPVDQRRAHWFLHQIAQALGGEKTNTLLRAVAETFSVDLIPLPSDPVGAKEFADYLKRFAPSSDTPPPPTDSPAIRGPSFKGSHGGIEHVEVHADTPSDTRADAPATPIHVPKRKTS